MFGASSEPAGVMEFGREPAIARASSLLASWMICQISASNQLRTSSEHELASVMEFGFNRLYDRSTTIPQQIARMECEPQRGNEEDVLCRRPDIARTRCVPDNDDDGTAEKVQVRNGKDPGQWSAFVSARAAAGP